jgi:hypothetical protein
MAPGSPESRKALSNTEKENSDRVDESPSHASR